MADMTSLMAAAQRKQKQLDKEKSAGVRLGKGLIKKTKDSIETKKNRPQYGFDPREMDGSLNGGRRNPGRRILKPGRGFVGPKKPYDTTRALMDTALKRNANSAAARKTLAAVQDKLKK